MRWVQYQEVEKPKQTDVADLSTLKNEEFARAEETDYSKYFNKGNDCDACLHQFLIREDAVACRKELNGEECDFVEVDEKGNVN